VPRTLVEIAIDAGLASRAEVARAGRTAEHRGVPLIVALVRDSGVDELQLLAAIRKAVRVTALDPGTARADPEALRMLPAEVCKRHRVLPVGVGTDAAGHRTLRIAMADPTDATALAEVEQIAQCEVDVTVLPLSSVEELVEQGFRGYSTQILSRRRPFGDGLRVTTQRHARPGGAGTGHTPPPSTDDTALTPLGPGTIPFHSVTDEADLGVRLQALVNVLVARGLITDAEYEQAVMDLIRDGRDSTDPTDTGGDD
jgi:hypothetical protein